MTETAEQQITRLNRDRTDRQYMIEALVPMLGPKGREVWALWQAKGVTRIHTSWAFDPMTIAGEEVADLHLKMEVAIADTVLVDDIDAAIAGTTLIDRPCRGGCNNPACCPVVCCHPLHLENARG